MSPGVFWAKSSENAGANGPAFFKSVAHHCADVAATALMLQRQNPARTRRDAEVTGLSADDHAVLCALFAGLHDIGKISKSFQIKVLPLWPEAILGACPSELPDTLSHWEATALLLNAAEVRKVLLPLTGPDGLERQVVAAIAGHHGRAPSASCIDAAEWAAARHLEIGPACVAAAADMAAELLAVIAPAAAIVDVRRTAAFSFELNGLITLSDWVGSDSAFFAFEDPTMPLADYWPLVLERAKRAILHKGLGPARPVANPQLAGLSGTAHAPRPMQALAAELALPIEPQIVVIEDGTGSGKTEAALLLAARLMAAGLGEGVFLAMPTMATANAMHARLAAALGGLFEANATLVLAHGRAALAKALARREASGRRDESDAARWCDAWIADSRKTALFASAGAGTIDQGFLGILPKKHLTLRQYALAGRVLVVDEAHACDAYMGEELKVLVEMQARLGGSVIVLSATLTHNQRAELVMAYARGRGAHVSRMAEIDGSMRSAAYPLLTRYCASTGVEEHAVDTALDHIRSVAIASLPSRAAVAEAALAAAARGAAVAIVCNAVDPAIATFEALLAAGAAPERTHLFHARFAMGDRLTIERDVQAWFGRASEPETRAGRILVATQVIEQSLDVDFDVMFTDLAPADLVVQRAGRLWRHRRDARPVDAPVLTLLTPDPGAVEKARWLETTLGPASFVYNMPGVLWRTARDLLGRGSLETPKDLRPLIETAYDSRTGDLPELLRKGHDVSVGEEYGKIAKAQRVTILPASGYAAVTSPSPDEEIGTRDGAASVTLRLARFYGDQLHPLAGLADGPSLGWALSEVSVRANWLARFQRKDGVDPDLAALITRLRSTWPEFEQNIPVFIVNIDDATASETHAGLQYQEKTGLQSADTSEDVP
jgi:CRISPR-associated endonuclease/helicase Cas3